MCKTFGTVWTMTVKTILKLQLLICLEFATAVGEVKAIDSPLTKVVVAVDGSVHSHSIQNRYHLLSLSHCAHW